MFHFFNESFDPEPLDAGAIEDKGFTIKTLDR